jgi:hypothetical protein
MTAPSKRTSKKENAFLKALGEGKSVSAAAILARVGRQSVYDWRRSDADFAARWDAAVEVGTDRLEDEAFRRGHNGVTKPVYHNGVIVGEIQEYSDTLLIFMLKGRRRSIYGDKHELMGKNGGPIQTVTIPLDKMTDEQLAALEPVIAALAATRNIPGTDSSGESEAQG